MSEDATQATETETSGQETQATTPKPTETVDFWKQKAREQETRAKSNAAAAQELETLRTANMTEQERLNADLESHRTRAEKAEAELTRLQVAVEKGLDPAQAKRLVGSTREELEADADDLLATFPPQSAQQTDPADAVAASLGIQGRGAVQAADTSPAAAFADFLRQMP